MRDLLSDDGTLYIHIGPNVAHYAKLYLMRCLGQMDFKMKLFGDVHLGTVTQQNIQIVTFDVCSARVKTQFEIVFYQAPMKLYRNHFDRMMNNERSDINV